MNKELSSVLIVVVSLMLILCLGEVVRRILVSKHYKQFYRRMGEAFHEWYRVMKGPPPHLDGKLPFDEERNKLLLIDEVMTDPEWLNNHSERSYLHDRRLMLRHANHDRILGLPVQIEPVPKHRLMWETNCDAAGWHPNSLEPHGN